MSILKTLPMAAAVKATVAKHNQKLGGAKGRLHQKATREAAAAKAKPARRSPRARPAPALAQNSPPASSATARLGRSAAPRSWMASLMRLRCYVHLAPASEPAATARHEAAAAVLPAGPGARVGGVLVVTSAAMCLGVPIRKPSPPIRCTVSFMLVCSPSSVPFQLNGPVPARRPLSTGVCRAPSVTNQVSLSSPPSRWQVAQANWWRLRGAWCHGEIKRTA